MPDQEATERRAAQAEIERRLETIEQGQSDMQTTMRRIEPLISQMATALTTLARIEERADAQRELLANNTMRLDNHSNRLITLETDAAAGKVTATWTTWVCMGLAGGIGAMALHFIMMLTEQS